MKTLMIVAAAAVLVGAWFLIEAARIRRLRRRAFAGRNAVGEDRMFRAHFQSKGVSEEVFLEVRAILGAELGTDPLLLRPQDDFYGNLRPLLGEEQMADLWIIQRLETRFRVTLDDAKLETCTKVDDLVFLVHQLRWGSHAA